MASNDVKIAEMRQKWIDSLRDAFAKLAAAAHPVFDEDRNIIIKEAPEHLSRILMMMNPSDQFYSRLDVAMKALIKNDAADNHEKLWGEYLIICQSILKKEWDRLRQDIQNAGQKPKHGPSLFSKTERLNDINS